MSKTSVNDYLERYETMRRQELVWGVVREPPAPFYNHQHFLTKLAVLLSTHVDDEDVGQVCVAPIDVVLDRERALIVQPDIIFIAKERLAIIDRQIWGAPDLVVEVLSEKTAKRDRTVKLGWYRKYGVRECWLVDPSSRTVEVIGLGTEPDRLRKYDEGAVLRSAVIRSLRLRVDDVFEGAPAI